MVGLSALCTGFTSCDDKKEVEDNNFAQAIAGTYSGTLSVPGAEDSNAQIEIVREDDSHAILKMNETVMALPVNIECRTAVTFSSSLYQIAGSTTFNMGTAEVPVLIPVDVTGTINGSGKALIQITVDVPGLGQIPVAFGGQK
jgi:hypothetical protein